MCVYIRLSRTPLRMSSGALASRVRRSSSSATSCSLYRCGGCWGWIDGCVVVYACVFNACTVRWRDGWIGELRCHSESHHRWRQLHRMHHQLMPSHIYVYSPERRAGAAAPSPPALAAPPTPPVYFIIRDAGRLSNPPISIIGALPWSASPTPT